MRAQEKNIKGFNILELLVVIVIISVVSAAAYPNFSSWRKERELRGAAEEIKNLFSNISSQVQRGLYAFVQVDVKEDATDKTLTITSKGMRMDTLMATARETSSWTTDRNIALGFSSTTGKRTGKGLILSKEFNPEDILMVPMMGNGNHSEKFDWQKEFVVMSKEGSFDDVMVEEILEW